MARTAYDEQFGVGLTVPITGKYEVDLAGYPEGARLLNLVPDAKVVLDKVNPTLVPRQSTPRASRPRRAAS